MFPVFPVSILSSIDEYVSAAYEVVSPLYKERIDPLEPWTFNGFLYCQVEVPIITFPS